jgi:hypothetical protein
LLALEQVSCPARQPLMVVQLAQMRSAVAEQVVAKYWPDGQELLQARQAWFSA